MLHSINQKTVALSLGIALLIAVCCSIGAWVAVDLSSALDRSALTTKILQTHMDADMMHDALRADVLAAVAARDPAFGISLDDVRKDLAGHSAQFRKDIGDNEAAADTANKRAVLQSLKTPLNAYIGGAEHMLELIARNPAAAAQAMPEFLQQFEVLEGAMASASQQFEAEQQVDILQGRDHGSLGRTFMLGLLVGPRAGHSPQSGEHGCQPNGPGDPAERRHGRAIVRGESHADPGGRGTCRADRSIPSRANNGRTGASGAAGQCDTERRADVEVRGQLENGRARRCGGESCGSSRRIMDRVLI